MYRVEFHDSDVLLQRRALGREYEVMYVISHQRGKNTVDSLILFEVDNRRVVQRVVFPRTPCPLTPLMNAYYPKTLPRVYANTTAERLNYLYTDYAQKTWITVLDTGLCSPLWRKSVMVQKLFIERK
ncbi:MAG: hypothetical protein NZ455_07870 [Bacteroidia bacterium]|nr:hypothetical protein [Bacteroidia bacterium]